MQSINIMKKLKTTTLLVIPLVVACFALSPSAQAETPAEGVTPELALPGFNTADGLNALDSLTSGTFNSAFGFNTLTVNTTGSHNTAVGGQALLNNNGSFNTAVGENALVHNIDGDQNMALGQGALANNLHGDANTAMGFQALNRNTVSGNTAIGFQAGFANSTGTDNVAVGYQALVSNNGVPPQGSFNNAHGNFALSNNTTGRQNNAFGDSALSANVTGSFNTAIGDLAGNAITRNWNIDIGKDVFGIGGATGDNFVTRIGIGDPTDIHAQLKCFIGGIGNAVVTGSPVLVNLATGQLGVAGASSARFKTQIKPMDKASEAILALKPITFRYKQEIDPSGSPQFGLVAEEVAKVNPDLVTRDAKGNIYTVRYEAVNAMLLNEFLKEHRKNEEQEKTIAELKSGMTALAATVKEQASQIQKVSAQLEASKPAPQVVNNP
jgi:trimeric autotransporter adhesin